MSKEGAVVVEGEAAAVPLYAVDRSIVLEPFRWCGTPFSRMELLLREGAPKY